MRRYVAVTGMGGVTPIGNTLTDIWNNIKNSYCGIDYIKQFDTSNQIVKIAGEVKDLKIEEYLDRKAMRRMDRVNQFGVIAAKMALEDSGLNLDEIDRDKIGTIISSGIGGLDTIQKETEKGVRKGYDNISPFFVPMSIVNMTSAYIAIELGLNGMCNCPVTACAGGTMAIGEAMRLIRHGYLDYAFAGGSESCIIPLGTGGFTAMKALNLHNDISRASIPFDKERDGFVMGEGAGILVLEDLEHARKRNAKIYAIIDGYGTTCDAEHITSPNPEGIFAQKAMENAVLDAENVDKSQIVYINAHGTSTKLNDMCETKAIKNVFGKRAYDMYVSSTKSMTGHLLGASGAVEAIFTILAMNNDFVPPTLNYKVPDEECDLNIVPNVGVNAQIDYALSNSFGFGGHNASILMRKENTLI
ncbi:beta-ketoacyl-acyl-carrier-protein synthase II [Peptoanaerobacter stomatis]|uniref:3-oxoacyl-[acyl-carrier-protein] synthase 2 n=1 Tax=Peptoanaerobacter stomatis TaxID=796937 RepID=J5U7D8_9FIRM|nr:beta-ketoacyl-ACP synthase II [Peptoanaerobacter stomatis]EHL17752.1 beta-ketoacyl-acyl-carrier-protein synthase II [Peptoanaerobacter stomatis]EJU20369.1 beta-ketoacyl-acyl-carrier-protein synthase II [Peptoanaerobacter stomatis]NWO25429.1 beta-ketoacyl-ACP synthase II [Peptostreptococcaceae bacterium oral taxon 081]